MSCGSDDGRGGVVVVVVVAVVVAVVVVMVVMVALRRVVWKEGLKCSLWHYPGIRIAGFLCLPCSHP